MRQSRFTVHLAIALAATALTSCQKPYHEETERYVLIAANIALPYWQEVQAGLRDSARNLGVKAEMLGPESYNVQGELDAFQQAAAKHPAGIMISPADAKKFNAAIDETVKAGIPVICIDSDAPESKRILFIGTDNLRAGRESGRRIAQLLHGRGDIIVITIPAQLNLAQRLSGVKEVFSSYPQIQITDTFDDKGDPGSAADQISAAIEKKEEVDGILCLEASGGSGAASALHRLNMEGKIPIVAMDKDPDTLDFIERGVISATIAQKPYTMAFYGLRMLDDLHHNIVHEFRDWKTAPVSPLPSFIDTGTAVVDKTNLATFREAFAPHPKPL